MKIKAVRELVQELSAIVQTSAAVPAFRYTPVLYTGVPLQSGSPSSLSIVRAIKWSS